MTDFLGHLDTHYGCPIDSSLPGQQHVTEIWHCRENATPPLSLMESFSFHTQHSATIGGLGMFGPEMVKYEFWILTFCLKSSYSRICVK